ncbi:MAG: bi-domain-containing oxidoreductase, partial [Rhizobiales bacterium]|nr:bi-domain-containing oxidoreductase [Hyphomicrobiales bacterium]
DDAAATVTLGAIALQGVRRAQPTLGETIVVVGLGILGQIAAQLLAASGCRVIGTDIDDQRIATATANGLHHGLNADRPDIVETVHRLTDGYGADGVVITAASSSDAIVAQAFQFCRRKGRVVVVGDVGLNIARADIYPKEIDLLISTSYGPGRYDSIYEEQGQDYPLAYVRWTENRNMAEYLRLLASGRVSLANMLRPPYEIDRAEKAYAALKAPGEKPLLVLLTYPEREAAAATVTVTVAPASTRSGVIRVALVGAGNFAQGVHLPNIRKLSDRFRVDTIVARTGLSATGVAERFGIVNASTNFAEVLADAGIDLVLIATRHHLHASMVLEALCTGKHVFVEKPLALSEEQLAPIVAFYEKNPNGPLLMTGYNRRFSPAIREAQRVLAGRTSPVIVNYRMNAGYIAPDHWVHGDEGGGRNIGEACHIYDIFAALTGSSPVSVQAMAVDPGSKYWRRDDNFTATIGYADGSVCTLTYTAMGSKGYAKERAEIFVDGKVLALDDYKQLSVVGAKGGWKSMTVDKGQEQELLVLSDVLRKGGTWPITLDDQLATSRVSFEVERQIKQ